MREYHRKPQSLRASLNDSDHGALAHRAGAAQSRASVGEDNRLRVHGFPPVPALHAETLLWATSGGGKEGKGAHIRALLLGPAAGPAERCKVISALTEFIVVKPETFASEAPSGLGFFEPLSSCPFLKKLGPPLAPFPLSLRRLLDLFPASGLLALIGEVMAGSAEKPGFSGGEIEFSAGPRTSRTEELHPRDPKRRESAQKGERVVVNGPGVPDVTEVNAQVCFLGGKTYRGHAPTVVGDAHGGKRPRTKSTLSGQCKDIQKEAVFHPSFGHNRSLSTPNASSTEQTVAFLSAIYAAKCFPRDRATTQKPAWFPGFGRRHSVPSVPGTTSMGTIYSCRNPRPMQTVARHEMSPTLVSRRRSRCTPKVHGAYEHGLPARPGWPD